MPTLDRDYIPTVGIGMDSSYLQTVERESRRIRWLPSISVQVLYWQSRTYYDNLQREEDDGIRIGIGIGLGAGLADSNY